MQKLQKFVMLLLWVFGIASRLLRRFPRPQKNLVFCSAPISSPFLATFVRKLVDSGNDACKSIGEGFGQCVFFASMDPQGP